MAKVIKGLSGMLKFDSLINHTKKVFPFILTFLKQKKMNDINKLKEWLDSDEGKAAAKEFVEELAFKENIHQGRFNKFEKWLENNDFDKLMYKLILEHNDEYREKCYENGYEPKPNNKMDFIFSYVRERAGKSVYIKEFESDFPNAIWEFKGYYFEIVWGQGCIQVIYNKEDKKRIFSI